MPSPSTQGEDSGSATSRFGGRPRRPTALPPSGPGPLPAEVDPGRGALPGGARRLRAGAGGANRHVRSHGPGRRLRYSVEGPSTGPGLVPAGPDLIEVGVEQRAPGTSDELGGAPAASPEIRVQATSALKAGAPLTLPVPPLWEGTVRLPHQRPAGQLRVVIREHEHLMANPSPGEPAGATGARRLVFAETITV